MTVKGHQHHAYQFFCGERSQALACLPFPSADGGEDGLIVALGAHLTNAQRIRPDTAQFLQNSQPSVVFNHYHSTVPGRFEDGGPLMEFVNSGGLATSICACGTLKPQQDLTSCILVGSKSGMVSSLSVTVPQRTTAQVEDITVNSGIDQTSGTITSSELHSGPVRAIRWMANTDQVATAGADGKLTVHSITDSTGFDGSTGITLAQADPWRSFVDACWLGPNAIVTAATAGEVAVWDARVSRGAVSRSRPGWVSGAHLKSLSNTQYFPADQAQGQGQEQAALARMRASLMSLRSVAALPSTPHACAVGHAMHGGVGGLMSAWDLRMMREPDIVPLGTSSDLGAWSGDAKSSSSAGSVIVRPDPQRAGGASVPLVAATTDGQLFEVDLGRGGDMDVHRVCQIEGGFVDVEADRTNGGSVVGCTDQQSVVIVSRPAPSRAVDSALMVVD